MIVNLTPHELVIFDENDKVVHRFPSEGSVRLVEHTRELNPIDGIPVVTKTYTEPGDLPAPQKGAWLVVSKMAMDALPYRSDLCCPDTGPDSAVRDESGRILGVRRLQR